MKLLSTLRQGTFPSSAGTGNYGGDLRLFFTTLNHADFDSNPAPIMWKGGQSTAAMDTYTLPSGDEIALNLSVQADIPGRLYLFGSIQVSISGGGFGPPIGQATVLFLPGQPVATVLKGRAQGRSSGTVFDVGFELPAPWDGTVADCHGAWWACWHAAPTVPSGLVVN